MALPSSGQIDLNAMHVEAGGGSGVQCSINDSDIRGLIGKGSGVQMAFSEWYGASSGWSGSVTVGVQNTGYFLIYGYGTSFGSITDTTIDNLGNAVVASLIYTGGVPGVQLNVSAYVANSGWSNLNIAGYNFARTSASYSTNYSNSTSWTWNNSVNPFGTTSGAVKSFSMT